MPRVIRVIESHEKEGRGIEDDPVRVVIYYYTLEGKFLAKYDPFLNSKKCCCLGFEHRPECPESHESQGTIPL